MAKDKVVDRHAELERENALLRQKLAEQEAIRESATSLYTPHAQSEIAKIRQRGKSTAGTILIKENHDHKNISLWTRDGRRIGPMHPENAEQMFNNLRAAGVMVMVDQPTGDQIEDYLNSPEGRKATAAEAKRRERKDKSRKAGQLEKLAEKIAAMSGQKVDEMYRILKQGEVKSVTEARA